MRLSVIYHKNSEHARSVYDFITMLLRRYPNKNIQEYDLESREGAAEATLYDVTSYPALVVSAYDGRTLGIWQGLPLPLIDEVAGMMLEEQGTTV